MESPSALVYLPGCKVQPSLAGLFKSDGQTKTTDAMLRIQLNKYAKLSKKDGK